MRLDVSVEAARAVLQAQAPHWAELELQPILPGGWCNRSFRLGPDLVLRMPSAARYANQPDKDMRWLPILRPRLPLPIPEPVLLGQPSPDFPFPWSVQVWLPGETVLAADIADPVQLAQDLARFLRVLHGLDGRDGPAAGPQNFHRGGDLAVYEDETQAALSSMEADWDTDRLHELWTRARHSQWQGAPVWLHGDVAPGNLLTRNGVLSAVIDFGSCGTGDLACDLVPAWTMFDTPARSAFVETCNAARDMWDRAAGWALWKAAITLVNDAAPAPERAQAPQTIQRLLDWAEIERAG